MIHINQVVQPFLCLKVIEPVLYDPSFLECSDRARLLSLRLNGSKRAKKSTDAGDFWQKVHSNDSPIQRQKSIQQGMHHWFSNSNDDSNARTRYSQSSISNIQDLRSFWSEGDKTRLDGEDDKKYLSITTSLKHIS
ncbi:MAG: hypothetical protein K2X77_00500 [Candidatus Obscuribacterales bacterium]|jgi:hypothetical protein|nr:hypothetical protein [Candidatus Obscuribacterales bacterium]